MIQSVGQEIKQDIKFINGNKGIYDGKIQNPSVRYGRNAIDNYKKYIDSFEYQPVKLPKIDGISDMDIAEFDKSMAKFDEAVQKMKEQKMPPIEFSIHYMPGNHDYKHIDKDALMGAAYESMDKHTFISTDEFTQDLQQTVNTIAGKDAITIDAESMDLNNDGKIDLAEYSATILLEDALSKDDSSFDIKNINGNINNQGENALWKYAKKSNYASTKATLNNIYKTYDLARAQKDFTHNLDNLA